MKFILTVLLIIFTAMALSGCASFRTGMGYNDGLNGAGFAF